jgi:hypothetical protein
VPGVGTTHHVKVGTEYCIIRPYSYQKMAAPLFGSRVSTGDPDYNNLSIWQHWSQSCWIGGIDADQWTDDAMYDEGVGVDTTVHERISLSRDLSRPTGGNLNAGSLGEPRRFLIFRNSNSAANAANLYCLTTPRTFADSYLWKYTQSTNTWSLVKTWSGKKARSFAVFGTKLLVGFSDATIQHCTDPAGAWTALAAPAGVTGEVSAMAVYNQKLYCAYGNQIWRRSTDLTTDGNVVFYKAEAADLIIDLCSHLGYLYMLSRNARVLRTDGNNTFDIWGWDSNTIGVSLASYDGRLFLATFEFTDADDVGFGVLYQFSGSAVTQLKRFGAEGRATTLGRLMVYDRKLWYGCSGLWGMNKNAAGTDLGGFGIATYDAVEDAHSIWATNMDTTTYTDPSGVGRDYHADDVIFFQGYMHVAVRGHGLFRSPNTYRDYLRARAKYNTTSTAATGTNSQGFITSSDYDAGTIGLLKLWREIVVHCDLASTDVSVGVDYSLDGGLTWTAAGTVTKTTSATRYTKRFPLNNVRANRFKYRLRLITADVNESPVVFGVVVAYLPLPEPNWLWQFVVVNSAKQHLLDGSNETVDTAARAAYFDNLFRTQQLFEFTDLDGTVWTTGGPGAFMYDYKRQSAVVGKAADQAIDEADLVVTILEAVESY